MIHSFTPISLKGVIFLSSPAIIEKDQGGTFGEQMSALANSWKKRFGGEDPQFVYTIPSAYLAPKITKPKLIDGRSTAVEIGDWSEVGKVIEAAAR